MIGRFVRNVLSLTLALGIGAGAVLTVTILNYRIELRSIESRYGIPDVGRQTASFVGFAADGTRVELSPGDRGLAVWYASRDCPYCKRDQEWTAVADFLTNNGIRVVVLPSSSSQQLETQHLRPKGAAQTVFVGSEWLSQFPLNVTPTLLIFDRREQLVWHKRGMLTAKDSAAVMRMVQTSLR